MAIIWYNVTMSLDWLLSQLTIYAPGFWIALSLLAAILLLFAARLDLRQQRLLQAMRWLFIPYWGMLLGVLSPRLMGLSNIDWMASFSLGAIITFVTLLLLILVRATINANWHTQDDHQQSSALVPFPDGQLTSTAASTSTLSHQRQEEHAIMSRRPAMLLGILYQGIEEFHWSFLRASLWELLLSLPLRVAVPAYWAIWGAAAIILLESTLYRQTLALRLWRVATLIATSTLFLYTRNFWQCWLLHALFYVMTPYISDPYMAAPYGIAPYITNPTPIITTKRTADTSAKVRRSFTI